MSDLNHVKCKFSFCRKSQFYILTAIIFCTILFVLVYTQDLTADVDTSFKNSYDNYIYESYNVINSALYSGGNLSQEFDNFTVSFINYAMQKNIKIKLFYIINTESNTIVGNHLGESANITAYSMEDNTRLILHRQNNISLNFGENSYDYDLSSSDSIQLKVLMIRER